MIIEAKMVKTLKMGSDVWVQGTVLKAPLPPVILQEIMLGTGTVQVLREESVSSIAPPIKTKSSVAGVRTSNKVTDDLGWDLPPTTTTAPPPAKKPKTKPKRKPKRRKL